MSCNDYIVGLIKEKIMVIELSPEELRRIITGKTVYRKCPVCHSRGYVWCYQNDIEAVEASEQDGDSCDWYKERYKAEYVWQEGCENCDAVGFVVAYTD